jgi:hypothetical protein
MTKYFFFVVITLAKLKARFTFLLCRDKEVKKAVLKYDWKYLK